MRFTSSAMDYQGKKLQYIYSDSGRDESLRTKLKRSIERDEEIQEDLNPQDEKGFFQIFGESHECQMRIL